MLRFLKPAVFCAALLPLGLIVAGIAHQIEPIEYVVFRTGIWALYFLLIGLAVTPLRKWLCWPALAGLRGMFGLFAFFYASLHVVAVLWLDHGLDLNETWRHIVLRPSNALDVLAYLMLLPLALTSTRRAKLRLGARRWQRLHQLAYVIAPIATARFWADAWTNNSFTRALEFSLVLAVLLGVRLYWRLMRPSAAPL